MKRILFLPLLLAGAAASAASDPFGVSTLAPSKPGGKAWFSTSWASAGARKFSGQDPKDLWFDCDHGSGSYEADGQGHLTASGPIVRMYVHHPDKKTEWDENLEITAYVTRLTETSRVSYSGPQIFARTNHGTYTGALGSESRTPCDNRGLGAKVNLDGAFAFEKETCHGADKGYATAAPVKFWPEGFPVGRPLGLKFLLRNVVDRAGKIVKVKLTLYCDQTGGQAGGAWVKVTETEDRPGRWGKGSAPCKAGVDPALLHTRENLEEASETGRTQLAVYFRHEYASMRWEKVSVREIEPIRE